MRALSAIILLSAILLTPASPLRGQSATTSHQHTPGMSHDSTMTGKTPSAVTPTSPGQATYGALAEIVGLLERDPSTDWDRVDLEGLRQHLIDMDDVTMNARVASERIDGGLVMRVTGAGHTSGAIRRMLAPHVLQLDAAPAYRATITKLPDGMQLTVVARRAGDDATIAKIRGLGFIGLLTYGDHHAPHHLALARGEVVAGHAHDRE